MAIIDQLSYIMMSQFDFRIVYRPGKSGGKPDALTRRGPLAPLDWVWWVAVDPVKRRVNCRAGRPAHSHHWAVGVGPPRRFRVASRLFARFSRTSSCASSNLDLLGKPLTNIFPAAVKMLTFPLTSRSARRETLAALAKKRARFVKPASTPPPLRETRQERKQMAAKDFTIYRTARFDSERESSSDPL
jgi:hypothetical protein